MRMPFLLSLKLCFKDCHKFGQDYHTHKVNLNFVGEKIEKEKNIDYCFSGSSSWGYNLNYSPIDILS